MPHEVVISRVLGQPIEEAFLLFTGAIDQWWQRAEDEQDAVIRLDEGGLVAVGEHRTKRLAGVSLWSPPTRIELDWHGPHSKAGDQVIVEFKDLGTSTAVSVRHCRTGLTPAAGDGGVVGLWWAERLLALAPTQAA